MLYIERNSPSKINIGLYVTEKRDDGYHNIQTIFYPIKLSDTIRITKASSNSFTSNDLELQQHSSNLIIRAKQVIEAEIGYNLSCDIHLQKNIPIGAGLGGGSSNAATTLILLNELFNLKLSEETLKRLSINLGSDVPFFLNSVPSMGTSRGEKLTPINIRIDDPLVLINPGINVSTKWAYENIVPDKKHSILKIVENKSFNEYLNLLSNDFEIPVFKKYPVIKEIKDLLLSKGAYYAAMSGSGSTVFGIFSDLAKANNIITKFGKKYFTFLNV